MHSLKHNNSPDMCLITVDAFDVSGVPKGCDRSSFEQRLTSIINHTKPEIAGII